MRFSLPRVPNVKLVQNKPVYRDHPLYIFENVSNSEVLESKYIDEKIVFKNVKYSFDEYGRRITWRSSESPREGAVLFFGSSVVFGKGINNNETIPSYFAKLAKNYEVYNYAVRAWGTQHYLEALRLKELEKEVTSSIKHIIFVISVNKETGHVQRLQGSMDLCTPCWWMKNLPVYRKEKGSFVFKGSFDKFMPFKYYLYKFLQNLRIVRYFRINVTKMGSSDYDTYTSLLEEIYLTASRKYPSAKIHFLLHPFSDSESSEMLIKSSGFNRLPVFDYTDLIAKNDMARYYFGYQWPYPKPELNELIAKQLFGDLLR